MKRQKAKQVDIDALVASISVLNMRLDKLEEKSFNVLKISLDKLERKSKQTEKKLNTLLADFRTSR